MPWEPGEPAPPATAWDLGEAAAPATEWESCNAGAPDTDWERCDPIRPQLWLVTPPEGQRGHTVSVELLGRYFVAGATVAISGAGVVAQNVVVVDGSRITVDLVIAIGAPLGARTITVTTAGGETEGEPFEVLALPLPHLDAIAPDEGEQLETVAVTLTGSEFSSDSVVVVSGAGIVVQNVVIVDDTEITAEFVIAAGAAETERNVTVQNGTGASGSVGFTVLPSDFVRCSWDPAQAAVNVEDYVPTGTDVGADFTKHPLTSGGTAKVGTGGDVYMATGGGGAKAVEYYASGVPSSPDYSVRFPVSMLSAMIGVIDGVGVRGRFDPLALTGYLGFYNNLAVRWELYSEVAGAGALLGTSVVNLPTTLQSRVLTLRMTGTLIELLSDDVVVISVNNAAVATAGRAGFRFFNDSAASTANAKLHIGQFRAGAVL